MYIMNANGKSISSVVNDPPRHTSVIASLKTTTVRRQHSPSTPPPTSLLVHTNESSPQPVNDSLKHLHDIKKINSSKCNKSPGQLDMPAPSLCNMCCRKDDVCVNLQHNHTTVLTVSDITRLPSWDIRQILAAVCSRCLVYISAITESSSKLRLRCEQAMHSQTVVLAPPTPDTSPNNFFQVSSTLLDNTPGHSNDEQQQRKCYAPGYCDDTANDLSMPLATSSPTPSALPPTLSLSPSPSNAGHNSMLTIHYERAVSPLTTESGGGGKNQKRSYQRIQVIPVQMICEHCNRAYWRKDYYRKHMRRCDAKYRYAKSMVSQRSRCTSRLELDAISLPSEENEEIISLYRPRIFRCNICTVTAENITELRKHKRIHLPHYNCDICSSQYTSKNEYEFHRAQCVAKMEVSKEAFSDGNYTPAMRKTRSFSRAISVAVSLPSSKALSTTKGKATAKRSRTPNQKVPNKTDNDCKQSYIPNYVKRYKSLQSDNDNVKEEDSDDLSEADTLYSKRLSLTNHWVEEHSWSSHSYLSQGDNYINDSMEDNPFRSLKEYDLYLLERLKNEVRLHCITCFVADCEYTCATLNEMMIHDYFDHFKRPWFNCYKCGCVFTSKVFLDYHLDMQNIGRYVCYKCGGIFSYQHQLDRHLIQHNRLASSGGEKFVCNFCNFEFLDEDKLLKHCYYENHDWNEKRHTIEIDHSMTISNKVQQKSSDGQKNTKYQVKILNMILKLMPSKRCTPMEKYRFHLPYLQNPKCIGQVEFPQPNNPNCVGCL